MSHFLDHLPDLDLPPRTLYRLQRGQGRLVVLMGALHKAGYELRPSPMDLTRKGGRRLLAKLSGLSRATIAALANGQGTVKSYSVLAATFRVTPKVVKRPAYAACLSSKNEAWETPRWLLGAILQAAGRSAFDLDPCSPSRDGPVPAMHHLTEAEDGLAVGWCGIIFVNPPYSTALPRWVAKCLREAANGAVVIALVPARTDTR